MDVTLDTGPTAAVPTTVGTGCAGGSCTCGQGDDSLPVLDVRTIPAGVRHAAVHGALDAVPVSGSLVLAAPHDPLPLLAELETRHPGGFAASYVERGPGTWLVKLTRQR